MVSKLKKDKTIKITSELHAELKRKAVYGDTLEDVIWRFIRRAKSPQ